MPGAAGPSQRSPARARVRQAAFSVPAGAAAAGLKILVMSRAGTRSFERAQVETHNYGRLDRYGRSGRPQGALLLLQEEHVC